MRIISDFTSVVLQEVPGEISIAISVTGCNRSCKGCHTPELQNSILGEEFGERELETLLAVYGKYLSCVVFFGGDVSFREDLVKLLKYIKNKTTLKTCLYTGEEAVDGEIKGLLDYLKVGEYKEECGNIKSKTTNQRFLEVSTNRDLTHKFWREECLLS